MKDASPASLTLSDALDTVPPLADASKRQRFEKLRQGPYFAAVVAANRAYLSAAVPDARAGEGERWVLTCLPTTGGGRRLSAVSMRNMETFVLLRDGDFGSAPVRGFVIVRRATALRGFASVPGLMKGLDLDDVYESGYQAAGFDQLALAGSPDDLIRALADPHIAAAAWELAEFLTTSGTVYARFHNAYLTDAVLRSG